MPLYQLSKKQARLAREALNSAIAGEAGGDFNWTNNDFEEAQKAADALVSPVTRKDTRKEEVMIEFPKHLAVVETYGFWPNDTYIYSFTGTRRVTTENLILLYEFIRDECHDAVKFITGACPGIDEFACQYALDLYPDREHEVIVPGGFVSGIDWVIPHDPRVKVIRLPPPPPGIKATKIRNALLVARAQRVCGFAAYPEKHGKSTYSGTWQTLRIANAAGKVHYIKTFIDEGAPWTEIRK